MDTVVAIMRDSDAEYDVAIDHMLEPGFDPNELAIVLDEAGDIERRALALREGETFEESFSSVRCQTRETTCGGSRFGFAPNSCPTLSNTQRLPMLKWRSWHEVLKQRVSGVRRHSDEEGSWGGAESVHPHRA